MALINWNPNFERELAREIERNLERIKVKIPMNTADRHFGVEDLSERERRIILWLEERGGSSAPPYETIAAALGFVADDVADSGRRLEARGLAEVGKVMGGEHLWSLHLTDAGKIAAADLRLLPEVEQQRAAIEARGLEKEKATQRAARSEARRSFFRDKILAPLVVGIIMLVIGRMSAGWFSFSGQQPTRTETPTTQVSRPAP